MDVLMSNYFHIASTTPFSNIILIFTHENCKTPLSNLKRSLIADYVRDAIGKIFLELFKLDPIRAPFGSNVAR